MKILTKSSIIRFLIMICIVGVACLGCQMGNSPIAIDMPTPIPPKSTKQVKSNSLPLVEKWKWSGLIHNLFGPPIVVVSEGRVIIATRIAFGDKKIVVFDAETGNVIWESGPISNLKSLHADDKRVYMGTIRYVRGYNLENGQVLWEGANQPSYKRGSLEVYSKVEQLEVYDPYDGHLYILDTETGQTIEDVQHSRLFFKQNNIYYSGICGTVAITCLSAIDAQSGISLWSHNFESNVYSWPVFIYDTMFVNAGGQLFAIRIGTGDVAWQSTPARFVTAVALGDNILYAIRNDAAIVGFDPETGNQVGVVEMTSSEDLTFKGGYVPYYAIAASDEFVAAYYSNSQELIVFEKVDSIN